VKAPCSLQAIGFGVEELVGLLETEDESEELVVEVTNVSMDEAVVVVLDMVVVDIVLDGSGTEDSVHSSLESGVEDDVELVGDSDPNEVVAEPCRGRVVLVKDSRLVEEAIVGEPEVFTVAELVLDVMLIRIDKAVEELYADVVVEFMSSEGGLDEADKELKLEVPLGGMTVVCKPSTAEVIESVSVHDSVQAASEVV
jgi:hypothetical protein